MFLFHGSPKIIDDRNMASGTFFTDEMKVAKEYGRIIYRLRMSDRLENCFRKDIFDEHWILQCALPMDFFKVMEWEVLE